MESFRYIITRACLQEGSLRLQRYLKPHFPTEGSVQLFDEAGHEYVAEIDRGERLVGVGPFYRDHHLNVNDVVMLTPLLPGCYKVEGIVKPYARPDPERVRAERAAVPSADAGSEGAGSVRVVVHASAHVREVRQQRPDAPVSRPWASMERETVERAQRAERYLAHPPLQASALQVSGASSDSSDPGTPGDTSAASAPPAAGARRIQRINLELGSGPQPEAPVVAERSVPLQGLPQEPQHQVVRSPEASRSQHPNSQHSSSQEVMVRPVRTPQAPQRETDLSAARESAARQDRAQTRSDGVQEWAAQRRSADDGSSAAAASQRLLRDLASAPTGLRRASREAAQGGDSGQPSEWRSSSGFAAVPTGGMTRADGEQLLDTLGRRWGYRVDYPAAALARLRADVGPRAHTVLVALGGGAVGAAEWRSAPAPATYRLWLTPQAQATLDAPVVTPEALRCLADAPVQLSSLDMQPVWEGGGLHEATALALIQQAGERQAGHEQAQRGFEAVMRVLAQQPSQSLVTASRLAGHVKELDPSQLNQVLLLLSRPPFSLLVPVESGHYLLRQEAAEFLRDTAQAWASLAGELHRHPTPASRNHEEGHEEEWISALLTP